MKYKTKIIPEGNGYVGYALLNDEVVFTTNVHVDTVMPIRELSAYIARQQISPVSKTSNQATPHTPIQSIPNNSVPPPIPGVAARPIPVQVTQPEVQPTAPTRKCCGRG